MFAMRRKVAEQAEANMLRMAGWSLRRIASELHVSLSSVSTWVRDVPALIPPMQESDTEDLAESVPPGSPESLHETRRCGRCEQELPVTAFNRNRGGWQWWCRDCYREYFRERGALHRRQTATAQRRRRQEARKLVDEHLQTHPCADCGEADVAVLEFDHVGPKRGNISWLALDGLSVRALRAEIEVCEVVCVNCHRRRTLKRAGSWRLNPDDLKRHIGRTPGEARNMAHMRDTMVRSGCVDCGVDDLLILEFDHVKGKTASVPILGRGGCSLERLREEIARCEVRCANCHRRRTRERSERARRDRKLQSPP